MPATRFGCGGGADRSTAVTGNDLLYGDDGQRRWLDGSPAAPIRSTAATATLYGDLLYGGRRRRRHARVGDAGDDTSRRLSPPGATGGDDTLYGDFAGGNLADLLYGDAGDLRNGGGGNDLLYGGGGDDHALRRCRRRVLRRRRR